MPHPIPKNFVQAVLMILDEYVEESQHQDGVGAPYEGFDNIDGLANLTCDFGIYLQHRGWDDERDNSYLTESHAQGVLGRMLTGK